MKKKNSSSSVTSSKKLTVTDRYFTIFDRSPISTQIFSPDGTTIAVNKAWEKLWGVPEDKVIGYNILKDKQLVKKGVMPYIKKAFKGEAATTPAIRYEPTQSVGNVGAVPYRILRASVYPVKDDAGKVLEVVLMHEDITEQTQYEQSLRDSEERYRTFIANSSEGIWRFELEKPMDISLSVSRQITHIYRYAYLAECNDSMAKMYGYKTSSDLVGARLTDLLIEGDEQNTAYLTAFIKSGYRLSGVESHEKDKRGKDKYFRNSLVGIIVNGEVIRAWGTQQDITKEKIAEEALRASEERYRNLVEMAPDIIFSIAADLQIASLTPAFEKLTGWKVSKWLGKNFLEIVYPEDIPLAIEKFKEGLAKKTQEPYELRILLANGGYMYGEFRSGPLVTDGKTIATIGIARDVTKKKFIDRALEESRKQLEIVLDGVADGISMQDATGKLVYINDAGVKISGYTSSDDMMTNQTPQHIQEFEIVDEEGEILPLDQLPGRRALRGEREPEALVGYRDRKTKEERWSIVKSRPIFDADGNVRFAINIFHDITDMRKAEEQMKMQLQVLENMAEGVSLTNEQGIIIYTNSTEDKIFGYEKGELIGKHVSIQNTYPPKENKRIVGEIMAHLKKCGIWEGEFSNKKKDGTAFTTHARITTIDMFGKRHFVCVQEDITDEKYAKEQLRQSEERFRLLVETTNVIPWESDVKSGNFTYVGPQAEKILGYKVKDWYQDNFWVEHIDPKDRKWVFEYCLTSTKTKSHYEFEYRMVKKNGESVWFRDMVSVIREKGKPITLRGFMVDITDRKKTEEQLEFMANVLTNVTDSVIVTDMNGKIIYWNIGAEKIFGYKKEEMLGNTPLRLYPDMDEKRLQHDLAQILQGKDFRGEWRGKTKDGATRWVDIKTTVLRDSNGNPSGFIGIAKDITMRVLAELALKQSEERYRLVVEKSHDLINLLDSEGNFLYANPSHTRLLGYEPEELIGKSTFALIHPDDIPAAQKGFEQALTKGYGVARLRYRHKDGQYIHLEGTGTRVSTDKDVPGVVAIFRDITDSIKLEKQKDEFIGVASHELKTPVTSLKAYAQALQRRFIREGDPESAVNLAKMDSQLDKLAHLISDLLDVTKLETNKLLFHEEEFDMNHLAEEIIEELQRTTEHHRIILKGKISGELSGDRERIGQVLVNFISNAIKYSPRAEKIIVKLSENGKYATVCVEDFGVGVSKEHTKHIFDRFYRVSGTKQDTYPGLGLGLYISKEIIKRQKGKIWVENKKSKGAIFCFRLPIVSLRKVKKT